MKKGIPELEKATPADYGNAVNVDGSRVDPFKALAANAYGVPYEEVTPDLRRAYKCFNFGRMYGAHRGRY